MNDEQKEKVIYTSTVKEKKRRHHLYELLLAFGLILLILGGIWTQLAFYGVDSWIFIVLLNINSIFMLIVLFLVTRSIVKLIMERRRKVFGAQLRTRLVLIFVSLSLIPTVIMFLASNKVVATSVDYWFTKKAESSLQAALDVGQSFYVAAAQRLRTHSETILSTIKEGNLIWGGSGIDTLLQIKQKEYGLTLIGIINPQGVEQHWYGQEGTLRIWKKARERIDWNHVANNNFSSLLWATDHADYVFGVLSIDNGRTGYLVTAESIGQGLLTKLDRISNGFEEYTNLKQLKKPLKISFLLILGILSMIIIFGSVWFGFRLSKEITAPILALAEGTTRIAQGELDVRLEDEGQDELGLLIKSFNRMAKDLQQGQTNLTKANELLAQQKDTLEERNTYIETVLDNITTGVITLDVFGYILIANKAACSIFNISQNFLKGRCPADFLPLPYKNIFHSMINQLHKHPDLHWQTQENFILGDHHWKLIIHAVAISGVDGIQAYVVVIEDITELEKMQRVAAWREVAKRIAHEIKNPLTPIKLSGQRLDKKFGSQIQDPVFKQCTEVIVKQVERLQDMVQEFSSFAKLPEVQLVSEDIRPVLTELVELFIHNHNEIQWNVNIPDILPEVLIDPSALHRALLNIITNAVEALEYNQNIIKKCIEIHIGHDHTKGIVSIKIQDSGPGLTPNEREKIFDPYFSRKKGGTGLGLAIVKAIIDDHKGTIKVFSSSLGGLSIEVELPIVTSHTDFIQSI